MKFPRNARILRGQLDAAPYVSVFFLLVMFMLVGTWLYTPGVPIELPQAGELPGIDQPTIAVAVDRSGKFYFQNQVMDKLELQSRLRQAAANSKAPLTLVVQADKQVTNASLVELAMLARDSGITNLLLATLPPPFSTSANAETSPAR